MTLWIWPPFNSLNRVSGSKDPNESQHCKNGRGFAPISKRVSFCESAWGRESKLHASSYRERKPRKGFLSVFQPWPYLWHALCSFDHPYRFGATWSPPEEVYIQLWSAYIIMMGVVGTHQVLPLQKNSPKTPSFNHCFVINPWHYSPRSSEHLGSASLLSSWV